MEQVHESGAEVLADGYYQWLRFADGSIEPTPPAHAQRVALTRGALFPPEPVSGRAAIWVYAGTLDGGRPDDVDREVTPR